MESSLSYRSGSRRESSRDFLFAQWHGSTFIIDGITVEVYVEGVEYREYNDPEEPSDPTQSCKYIEARHGSRFQIEVTITQDISKRHIVFLGDVLTCAILVDGKRSHSTKWDKPPPHLADGNFHLQETCNGVQDKDNHHEWKFDLVVDQSAVSSKTTQIEILFGQANVTTPDYDLDLDEYPEDLETTGLSDTVAVNPSVRRAQNLGSGMNRVGKLDDDPFFRFKCCERGNLEALGIVSELETKE